MWSFEFQKLQKLYNSAHFRVWATKALEKYACLNFAPCHSGVALWSNWKSSRNFIGTTSTAKPAKSQWGQNLYEVEYEFLYPIIFTRYGPTQGELYTESNTFSNPIFIPDYMCPGMLCLALSARRKVWKLDFQSEFSMSKIIRIFLIFFHWRIIG